MLPSSLTVYTAPPDYPITLAEAKAQLRITSNSDEDALITSLIVLAREQLENELKRTLVTTVYEYRLDDWPESPASDRGGNESWPQILLPRPPLVSVASITYIDPDGVSTVWSDTEWDADIYSLPGSIYPATGYSWPSIRNQPNAITIRYTAGQAVAAVPESIKQACRLLVEHYFSFRGPVIAGTIVAEVPRTIKNLIWSYKMLEFY